MKIIKKQLIPLFVLFLLFFNLVAIPLGSNNGLSLAQTTSSIPECAEQKLDRTQCEEYLKNKINEKQGEKKTLSSQIAVMDNQIKLTEYRIAATEGQITDLVLDIDTATKKISGLETSLNSLIEVLINRIVATYEVGTIQPLGILLTSSDASDFMSRLNYLKRAQEHDKKLIYETQQAKVDYSNQKTIFEDKKKQIEILRLQLEEYTRQLERDKTNKQTLLEVTKNDEARYQRLLQQAQAERAIVFGGGTETYVRDVNQGDSIGSIASRSISPGCSTGAHLHFEVQKNGSVQDPNGYLKSVSYSYSYSSESYGYYGTINPTGDLPWPLNEPITINQGFGSHGYAKTFYSSGSHAGIDMDSSSSTVKSIKAGKLYGGSYSCTNGKLYYAKVVHDDGLTTWYLHMIPN
ncbi:MAG: hypothetical protein COU25_01375 [Candidatus Levybacteria bacterium CG10_big_fil_rev_8_21_14_0_10_35_13]|nr:MAG: hypothetical protein COU25_01375 [Candidatus Levybacteria bacterium CG10_big_fil_rev_8_21_14_0_10_35_13]